MALVLRLVEELQLRKATITGFFLAYVYSNTDNIQANLYYLDYSRLKKLETEEKRKKEAISHFQTMLPELEAGHDLPTLAAKDLEILDSLSEDDIPIEVRERYQESLKVAKDRIAGQKEQDLSSSETSDFSEFVSQIIFPDEEEGTSSERESPCEDKP